MHLHHLPRSLRLGFAAAISFAAVWPAVAQYAIVQKSANFIQTGTGAPAADPLRTYEFGAFFSSPLGNPSLTSPTGRNLPLALDGDEYGFDQYATTKLAFDTAFPSGNYALTATGRPPLTLNLSGDLYPTTVPQITNGTWNAGGLLILDPTRENTITINAFAAYATAGVGGYSEIQFDGDVEVNRGSATASLAAFGAPVSSTPVTSIVIPARSMTSGRVYSMNANFATIQNFTTSATLPNGALTVYSNFTKIYIAALAPGATAVPAPVIARQPVNVTARAGTTATFTIGLTFNGSTTFPANGTSFSDWYFNGNVIDSSNPRFAGTNGVQLIIRDVTPADAAGEYSYRIVTTGGIASSNIVNLTLTTAPAFTGQPTSRTVVSGTTVVFAAVTTGVPTPTYQWRKDGAAIPGATSATLVIPNTTAANAGNYTMVATNSIGTATSNTATLTISASPDFGRIINLSVLTSLAPSEGLFTVGTVIGGAGTTGPKPLLVRAAGPTLGAAPFNIPGTLPDPKLEVFSGSTVIAANNDWLGTAALTNAFTSVGAFPYVAAASKDAAYFNPALAAGAYTIQVADTGGGLGLVIAELYDATPGASFTPATPRLINVSVLKQIPAGGILTVGFVIGGSTAKTVLIRAVGPTIGGAPFNVPGTMADPQLALFNSSSVQIAGNDNWGGDAALAAASTGVGAFALNSATSKDAILLVTLSPGAYTAQASGVGSTGGQAIVEVYEVP